MPKKITNRSIPAKRYYKNVSFETLVAVGLLMMVGKFFFLWLTMIWKTDVLVSNGGKFLRIQVKTVDTNDESCCVENKWGEIDINYVIYFSKISNWGYIAKSINNSTEHIRFHQHAKSFIKAFVEIWADEKYLFAINWFTKIYCPKRP